MAQALDSSGTDVLNVGDRQISLADARALITGYCFAEQPGRWETDKVSGNVYGDALPEVTWRRWAYRAYDCAAAPPGNILSGADLLMPVGLNVVQGYGTELVESLTAAAPLVSEVMGAVPEGATFWDIDRNEIEPAGTPTEGSVSWALHRSWAILMSVPGCGLTITHKILHHKWPKLVPLIDSRTVEHLKGGAWLAVHSDLATQQAQFEGLEDWFRGLSVEKGSTPLTRLRLHDILLWCIATGEDAEATAEGRIILHGTGLQS